MFSYKPHKKNLIVLLNSLKTNLKSYVNKYTITEAIKVFVTDDIFKNVN